MLPVNLDTEEIYESRAYQLLLHPSTLASITSHWLRVEEPPSDPESFLEAVTAIVERSSLKVLAKRDRGDGRITYAIVAVGPETRTLIERAEVPDEAAYRRAVVHLEDELLAPGLLAEPIVVGPDEWSKYEQQES